MRIENRGSRTGRRACDIYGYIPFAKKRRSFYTPAADGRRASGPWREGGEDSSPRDVPPGDGHPNKYSSEGCGKQIAAALALRLSGLSLLEI